MSSALSTPQSTQKAQMDLVCLWETSFSTKASLSTSKTWSEGPGIVPPQFLLFQREICLVQHRSLCADSTSRLLSSFFDVRKLHSICQIDTLSSQTLVRMAVVIDVPAFCVTFTTIHTYLSEWVLGESHQFVDNPRKPRRYFARSRDHQFEIERTCICDSPSKLSSCWRHNDLLLSPFTRRWAFVIHRIQRVRVEFTQDNWEFQSQYKTFHSGR